MLLDKLPSEGRISGSERNARTDVLGHTVLPGGVLATYRLSGHEARSFISDLGCPRIAADAVGKLRSRQSAFGVVARHLSPHGVGDFQFAEPAAGSGVVVQTGRYVADIFGELPSDELEGVFGTRVEDLLPANARN